MPIAYLYRPMRMDVANVGNCTRIVSSYVYYSCFGVAVYFAACWLIGGHNGLVMTLVVSVLCGLFALLISGLWISRKQGGKVFMIGLILAYLSRIFVGLLVYLELDPTYFSGSGTYAWGHPELELSYKAASLVYDFLSGIESNVGSLAVGVLSEGDSKNPIIHSWMGLFMFSSGSSNALDLMAFNAFHHCLAGSGITALALHYRYPQRTAKAAGLLTAWIPWSFPASLLWRDSIGLFFVVFAVAVLTLFNLRKVGSYFWLIVSLVLAFAHRTIYPVALLTLAIFESMRNGYYSASRGTKGGRRTFALPIAAVCAGVFLVAYSETLLMYTPHASLATILNKIWYLPIFIVRSIFGPFPWFQELSYGQLFERIWDYGFHVLQLAVFMAVLEKPRTLVSSFNPMVLAFLLFYFMALLAPGIHTSYLSMSLPFLLPHALKNVNGFPIKLLYSLFFFLSLNVIYYLVGLSGEGLVINFTGY